MNAMVGARTCSATWIAGGVSAGGDAAGAAAGAAAGGAAEPAAVALAASAAGAADEDGGAAELVASAAGLPPPQPIKSDAATTLASNFAFRAMLMSSAADATGSREGAGHEHVSEVVGRL